MFYIMSILLNIGSIPALSSSDVQSKQNFQIVSFEKILIRNKETNPQAILTYIKDAVVSSDGCVYIVDANRILKYDRDGVFIRQIGKNGQGPGEYRYPKGIRIDSSERLWVNDQGRSIIIYDSLGKFLNGFSIQSDGFLEEFEVFADGNIMGVWDVWNENGQKKVLRIVSENDRGGKTIREYDVLKEKGGNVVGGIIHSFLPNLSISTLGDGMICFGFNMDFRIFILNQQGRETANFSRDEKPESTKREKREIESKYGRDMLKNYHLPEWKPFFERLLGDEGRRIYVIRPRPLRRSKLPEPTQIDVFSPNGRLLGIVRCPGILKAVRAGCIYSVGFDEEDSPFIAIYRLPKELLEIPLK